MKKISIFIPAFETGGVENNVILYSKILVEAGYDVDIVYVRAVKDKFDKVDERVKKVNIGKKLNIPFIHQRILDSLSLLFDYYKYLKNNDVLVLSFQNNIVSIIVAKLLNKKIIVRIANHPNISKLESSLVVKISNYLKTKIYKYADLIITNAEVTTNDMKKILNVENIKTIYNPSFSKEIIKKADEKIDIEIKDKKIISVGRLVKQKDFLTLLKAFKIVKEKLSDASLIIIGEGSERKNLEEFIQQNNLKDVYLLGYQTNPYKYMKNSDLFVLSSLYEGLPNVMIEAISLGLPVVSTDCKSGPSEILLDGKGGDLVEVGNYKKLAEKIIYNLENRNYAKKKWQKAYEKLDRFSYEQISKKILKTIEEVISEK